MSKGRKPFHIAGSSKHFSPDREFHADHIRVELKVDLEERRISGSCTTWLLPVRAGLNALHLDAREMEVGSVKVDGGGVRFDYDGSVLTLRPGAPLSQDRHEVRVEYSSRPRQGVYFVHPDEEHPEKPVQAWTQCEAQLARYWYPCHDHPDDKATSEMVITVPEGYRVVSNGRLVSRQPSAGWETYHWSESAPHSTYLNSFVVGKLEEAREESEGVELTYYFPEEKRKDAHRCFGLTPDMIRVFNEMTGIRYPYEKYAQVAVHDFIYGGMENISATTLTDTRFPDERSEEDYSARYSRPDRTHVELVAHELAHMWFGDLVTAKHWPHAWLNEGFATYFEALYHERRFGVDEFRQNMVFKAQTHIEEDGSRYRRPIVDNTYVYADDLFDSFTYEKAAWMIHQLRYILGDELFFRGTREYLKRHSYGNADTHDYMEALEETSGLSLEGYFEQFFFRGGYPEFEVEYSWDDAGSLAQVSVRQTQKADELTPVFQVPCDIVFYTSRGRQLKRVNLRGAEERFSFQLDSEPSIVEFDPEEWLLKKASFKRSFRLLANQLEGSVDSPSRMRAAEQLSSFKTDGAVDVLKKAAEREQYWTVRAEAVRSIGKVGTKKALEVLLGFVAVKNRRVRRAVAAALSEFKGDSRVHSALKEMLLRDESPFVQCEAALSLGKTAAPDTTPLLSEAMKLPSVEHAVTEASLEALGFVKSPEARSILKSHLPYGHPTRVRIGALKGYIRLGSMDEDEVRIVKEIATKDKEFVVRDQVLEVVAELGDRRFLDTMKRVAEEDVDDRNRRRAMEVYEELTSGAEPSSVTGLREDVERLKSESRELRERLTSMNLS